MEKRISIAICRRTDKGSDRDAGAGGEVAGE